MMLPRTRTRPRPTLSPTDEEKLAPAAEELRASLAASKRSTANTERVAAAIEADTSSLDGVVLEPVEEDDSLVVHVEESLRELTAV